MSAPLSLRVVWLAGVLLTLAPPQAPASTIGSATVDTTTVVKEVTLKAPEGALTSFNRATVPDRAGSLLLLALGAGGLLQQTVAQRRGRRAVPSSAERPATTDHYRPPEKACLTLSGGKQQIAKF